MNPGDRMAKGLDFMLKGIGPKDKTPEAEGTLQEPGAEHQETGAKHQDLSIKSQESRVTTTESRNKIIDAVDLEQDSSVRHQQYGVMTRESGISTQDSAAKLHETRPLSRGEKESGNGRQESGVVTDDIIEQAVAKAMKSPKISLYSPLLLAVLESQQLMLLNRKEMTLLQYRKATKARELVKNALRES